MNNKRMRLRRANQGFQFIDNGPGDEYMWGNPDINGNMPQVPQNPDYFGLKGRLPGSVQSLPYGDKVQDNNTLQPNGMYNTTGTHRVKDPGFHPNYGFMLGSNIALNLGRALSNSSGNSTQNATLNFNKQQFNPLNFLPNNPNVSQQALYGQNLYADGGSFSDPYSFLFSDDGVKDNTNTKKEEDPESDKAPITTNDVDEGVSDSNARIMQMLQSLGGMGGGNTSMGQLPQPQGTTGNTKGSVAERNNNPGNLVYAKWMDKYGATHGDGSWAHFPDMQSGLQARQELLTRPLYANKTVDSAMKLYSNKGYDGNIYPEIANKKMSNLSPSEMAELTRRQLVRENGPVAKSLGYKEGGAVKMYFSGGKFHVTQSENGGESYNYDTGDLMKKGGRIHKIHKTVSGTVGQPTAPQALIPPSQPQQGQPQVPQQAQPDDEQAEMKKGGWLKNAVNPAHKGYCTPMSKSTCTPRRKAFALRAKHHNLEEGGMHVDVQPGINDIFAEGGIYDVTPDQMKMLKHMGYDISEI